MDPHNQLSLQKVPIEANKETLIEIDKNGRGLGLSLIGGSDTVLGSVVSAGHRYIIF